MEVSTSMLMSRRILARARPRRRARVRRSAARLWKLSLLVAVASLVGAASASADTVFSDGFESGDFSAWSQVQTNVDGTAAVQGTTVSTGSFAAQLSESATAGSKAYARKTLASTQQDLSASGDFRVVAQGIAGQNVPFFRFLDPTSARVVSIYRQNGTFGRIYVNYGGELLRDDRVDPARHLGDDRAPRDHQRCREHGRGAPERNADLPDDERQSRHRWRPDRADRQRHRGTGVHDPG